MSSRAWIREMAELLQWARVAIMSCCTNGLLPLRATIGSFLIVAGPVLLAMLLWLLDLSEWRPGPGFYTIRALGTVTLRAWPQRPAQRTAGGSCTQQRSPHLAASPPSRGGPPPLPRAPSPSPAAQVC